MIFTIFRWLNKQNVKKLLFKDSSFDYVTKILSIDNRLRYMAFDNFKYLGEFT